MKFYHVENTGHLNAKAHWVVAKDESDAIRIASTEEGTPTNVKELTPEYNISQLLSQGESGLLCKRIQNVKHYIMNRGAGKPVDESPWSIYKKI